MEQETTTICQNHKKCKNYNTGGTSNVVYGLGLIGALVYFIQHADTFWVGVLGILKAIAWPALFVYKLLEYLKF